MTSIKTPGVYVQEISKLPPSVAQVATAIPAFIGYTEFAKEETAEDLENVPTRIISLLEYETYFGGPDLEGDSLTVNLEYDSTAKAWAAKATVTDGNLSDFTMYYNLHMYFANGGGPCYIVSVGGYTSDDVDADELKTGLAKVAQEDEVTLLVFPDATNMANDGGEYYGVMTAALKQCADLKDRFAVSDVYNDSIDGVEEYRTGMGTTALKYGAGYFPFLETNLNYSYDETKVVISVDTDFETADEMFSAEGKTTLASLDTDVLNGAYNAAKAALKKVRITLPPSSTVVGIYAYVDKTRGVWKAPANTSLTNVIKPTLKIDNAIQDDLNVHGTGKSVNAIRSFTGKGILIWGARTLAGNNAEWRYVSVRRLFNMVEESIQESTEWAVFEPNDANTWIKIKGMIENYLTNLWKQGALAGAKPDQAFYVNVGLGTTMTAQDILDGFLNVEIGMAAVRPAEFIVLKFSHKLQES